MKPKRTTLVDSFVWATRGVLHALHYERNMRIHVAFAALVLILAVSLKLSRTEMALLIVTMGLVIAVELINTAIERVVNMVTESYHPLAALAKNVAAGAVLVTAITAIGVGTLLFYGRLIGLHPDWLARSIQTPVSLVLLALGLVVAVVVVLKAGVRPFRVQGGMPSGHAGLAFALATAVFYLSESEIIVIMAYALAALVAQSRVEGRMHTWIEVAVGAIIGSLLTVLVFQVKW